MQHWINRHVKSLNNHDSVLYLDVITNFAEQLSYYQVILQSLQEYRPRQSLNDFTGTHVKRVCEQ